MKIDLGNKQEVRDVILSYLAGNARKEDTGTAYENDLGVLPICDVYEMWDQLSFDYALKLSEASGHNYLYDNVGFIIAIEFE